MRGTLKGSLPPPNGSNADNTEGLPLKFRPLKFSSEGGMEKAANGSRVEPNPSECVLSSLATLSSAPSSRWELVLNPLRLLTGLLDPA